MVVLGAVISVSISSCLLYMYFGIYFIEAVCGSERCNFGVYFKQYVVLSAVISVSISGGMVVLGAVIAVIYYCYRKKSKSRQMTGQPGLFGRIGFRNRTNHIHQTNQGMETSKILTV